MNSSTIRKHPRLRVEESTGASTPASRFGPNLLRRFARSLEARAADLDSGGGTAVTHTGHERDSFFLVPLTKHERDAAFLVPHSRRERDSFFVVPLSKPKRDRG